jgi:hypothetical protein
MTTAEERISQLEKKLTKEMSAQISNRNCYKIAYTQFRLSQLYKLAGIPGKSEEMISEAYSTLQRSECSKSRKAQRLLNVISLYRNNPLSPPLIELPPHLKFIGPIILLAGYLAAYILYFRSIISYTFFFVLIFVMFAFSMAIPVILSSSYVKSMKMEYQSHRPSQFMNVENSSSPEAKTPDDLIDDARAEISLANYYYSLKDAKEAETHLEKAKRYLSDPLANQSKKREEAIGSLSKLENALRERKLAQG